MAKIDHDDIRDSSGRIIVKIINNELRNPNYVLVAKIQDIKKEIDGSDYLDQKTIAVIWICFIKRGI